MCELRIQIGTSPLDYRFIDWRITGQLQMVDFTWSSLQRSPTLAPDMFWHLMLHCC